MQQLNATWDVDGKYVLISRDGDVLVRHPVTFSYRGKNWLKDGGNGKTSTFGHAGIGILNSVRNSCFRSLVQCDKCDRACYSEEGSRQSGCFAQTNTFSMLRWNSGFNIILNGVTPGTEKFFSVHKPKSGNYDLSSFRSRIFRCDSESSTSCLSLSLGMIQEWARHNPRKIFSAISSAYFKVSDERLQEVVDCGNIVVGVSLSGWHGIDDTMNRIMEARRYQNAGVPVVIWIATRPDWSETDEWGVIMDEVSRYDPRQIVEVPYHERGSHSDHIMGINPWGGCCQFGIDKCGRTVDMGSGLRKDDGSSAEGKVNGSCVSCKNACGASWLKISTKGQGR